MNDISWILDAPVKVLLESIVDEFVKKNSEFNYLAGLRPKVIRRTTSAKPCEWCANIAGTYEYPDIPSDVWKRHDNCHCVIEYISVKGEKPEYNYQLSKEARIKRAEEMAKTEKARKATAREKRIDTWTKKKETNLEALEKRKQIRLEKSDIRTLGSDVNLTYPRTIRKEIGEIDINKLNSAKKYFSDKIRNERIENSIVIQNNGQVIHFIGEKSGLSMWNINFIDATIIHNHPAAEGIVSFGKDDFEFLKENQQIRELIAVNEKYNYSVKVLKDLSLLIYNDYYRRATKFIFDDDFEVQHGVFRLLDDEGMVKYERKTIVK